MFNTSLEVSKKLPERYKEAPYLIIKNLHKDFCKHLFFLNLPVKTQISLVVYFEKFLRVFVFNFVSNTILIMAAKLSLQCASV